MVPPEIAGLKKNMIGKLSFAQLDGQRVLASRQSRNAKLQFSRRFSAKNHDRECETGRSSPPTRHHSSFYILFSRAIQKM
jgi:hypothetical protein